MESATVVVTFQVEVALSSTVVVTLKVEVWLSVTAWATFQVAACESVTGGGGPTGRAMYIACFRSDLCGRAIRYSMKKRLA
jgi:hypothetical protein